MPRLGKHYNKAGNSLQGEMATAALRQKRPKRQCFLLD